MSVHVFNFIFDLFYEGEETLAGGSGNDTLANANDTLKGGNSDDDKPVISNKKMNELLKKEKEKHISQLEELRKSKGISDQEKEALASQIDELKNSLLTKEQLAQKEKEKLEKTYKQQVEGLSSERDIWKSRYNNTIIRNEILSVAATEDAFDSNQFVTLLKDNARTVEVLDAEGKPTGDFTVKIKYPDVDKEGKPVVLDLTVTEAVKRMKDNTEKYGNLFKVHLKNGLGDSSGSDIGGNKIKLSAVTKDFETYKKNRQDVVSGKIK